MYNNLAQIYRDLERYENALKAQQKSIVIMKQVYELNHPRIASSYNNLSLIYKDLGDYQNALKAQKEALAIIEQLYDPNHLRQVSSYHTLVSIFYYISEMDSAIYYEEKAYSILSITLPVTHPNLKSVKFNLAFLYDERGQKRQAAHQYQAAIEDFQETLIYTGDSAMFYNRIGLCYFYKKEYKKAIKHYDKSYSLNQKDKWIYLNNSGLAYAKSGDFTTAKTRFEEFQKLLPENSIVYRDWAIYYALKGDKATALSNLEKAIKLGYRNLEKIKKEEAFEILHQEPRYQVLIKELENKKNK